MKTFDPIATYAAIIPSVIEQNSRGSWSPDIFSRLLRERIIFINGPIEDNLASVVVALRGGAVDYLTKPAEIGELVEALQGSGSANDVVPDTPLGVDRLCWEHVHRIFEQCGRNVSRTAHVMGMHRRTLQRMLGKRAPRPRAIEPT